MNNGPSRSGFPPKTDASGGASAWEVRSVQLQEPTLLR